MINIEVERFKESGSEISERKGIGHPDTLCDLIAENLSLHLSRYYLDHFGFILHHNVDKLLLAGGKSSPQFGGGSCSEPIRLFFAGRATLNYKGKNVPIDEIIHSSLEDLLAKKFQFLKKENFEIHNVIRPGSSDLVELFERGFTSGDFLSNDTSCGTGYAPLSPLEKTVLHTEQYLNSKEAKNLFPEIGEDIKIMGMRQNEQVTLTAGIAFIDRFLQNADDYSQKKENIEKVILQKKEVQSGEFDIRVNTGDDIKNNSIFMTVTGSSAEAGDDGEVGRGNRPNGLISTYRPMTMEALAGKNSVTHVGKLYNWIAMEIAQAISDLPEIEQCFCYLVSRIGHPVSKPYYTDIQVKTNDGKISEGSENRIREIVEEKLQSLKSFGINIVKENKLLII